MYFLTVSVSQESGSSLAVLLGLKVSHEVAKKLSDRSANLTGAKGSISKVIHMISRL